jgi:putative phosphoesterase
VPRVRVAAVCDVHGNLPALEAALAAIEAADPDLVVFGGDLVWGPLPRETLERIMALDRPARFVRGDADRDVVDAIAPLLDPDDPSGEVSRWCRERLTPEQLEFLMAQDETLSLDVDGLGPTLFCHGSPRSDRDRITVGSADEKVLAWLEGVEEGVVVCGHTHAPFDRRFGSHRVVNPGGCGLQFGERGAVWALLGPDVDLRLADYDCEGAAALFRATGGPAAEPFAERVVAPPPAETAVERWG